jgi:hypothetical protein
MTTGGQLLPNLIIAGAPKSGTSSVHDWLAAHPQANGSEPKETYYFVDPGTHMHDPACHIANGLAGYARFFRPKAGQPACVVFESTPGYLYYPTAIEGLHDLPTAARILFILREPAAQIYSGYRYFRENWDWVPQSMSFAAYIAAVRAGSHAFKGNELAVNALDYGDYCHHLLKWRERFGADRIKVMLFDDLLADEAGFMKDICTWLGIDPTFYDSYDFPRANETYAVRSAAIQKINIAIRRFLVPLGGLYRFARGIYRRLNTQKPTGPSAEDRAVMRALKSEFAPANARLAREFGLDLSAWSEEVSNR